MLKRNLLLTRRMKRFELENISFQYIRICQRECMLVGFSFSFSSSQLNELSILTSAIIELEGVDDDVNS